MVKTAVTMLLLIGGLIVFAMQAAPAGQACVTASATITGVAGFNSTTCAPTYPFNGAVLQPSNCQRVGMGTQTLAKVCVSGKVQAP